MSTTITSFIIRFAQRKPFRKNIWESRIYKLQPLIQQRGRILDDSTIRIDGQFYNTDIAFGSTGIFYFLNIIDGHTRVYPLLLQERKPQVFIHYNAKIYAKLYTHLINRSIGESFWFGKRSTILEKFYSIEISGAQRRIDEIPQHTSLEVNNNPLSNTIHYIFRICLETAHG